MIIPDPDPDPDPGKTFRIRPDPDPQPWTFQWGLTIMVKLLAREVLENWLIG